MAKKPGKFVTIWVAILCGVLYLPFRQYLTSHGYGSAEEFFEDMLSIALGLSVVVVPAILVYIVFFKESARAEQHSPGKAEQPSKTRGN